MSATVLDVMTEPCERQIDGRRVRSYLAEARELLAAGNNELRKEFVRRTVEKIELAPERMELTISYRIPEPVLNGIACRDTNGSGGGI